MFYPEKRNTVAVYEVEVVYEKITNQQVVITNS